MMNSQTQQIQINVNNEDLKGRFSNAAQVSTQDDHFVIDFFMAALPVGQLVSRIVVSPRHMKSIQNAIAEQIKIFEDANGKINVSEDKSIGFRTE